MNIPKQFRVKFDAKVVLGHFIGYVNDKDGYKVWVPSKHRIIKSRDVDFRPEKLCTTKKTIDFEFENFCGDEAYRDGDSGIDRGDADTEGEATSDIRIVDDNDDCDNVEDTAPTAHADPVQAPAIRSCPVRTTRLPVRFEDYEVSHQTCRSKVNSALICLTEAVLEELEPTNFSDAMKSRHSDKWLRAMRDEVDAFSENDTWDLVSLPPGKRAIDNR